MAGPPNSSLPAVLCQNPAVTDLDELKIPKATRPGAQAIIALTDQVCCELLDDEYAGLARRVVAKLARKRLSPIQSGRASTWAGAVVYALGQVNFLFDRATEPYATADDLSAAFGVAKSTLSARAKQVRDLMKMSRGTPEFLREDMADASPLIWFIQVNGLIADARDLPLPVQAQAFELGVIPYIPALGRAGTAAWLNERGQA
jgi:Domain of unknown function (DUF6398)